MKTVVDDDVHVVLDATPGEAHFIENETGFTLHRITVGSDSGSYRYCIALASTFSGIVVLLEDDYRVAPSWRGLIEEGLGVGSYVTLYDHPDKYLSQYKDLPSRIFKGSRHWRTTPSTTSSFAARASTLLEDKDVHIQFAADDRNRDHERFLTLWTRGRQLVSCMPGAWSHEEMSMQTDVV